MSSLQRITAIREGRASAVAWTTEALGAARRNAGLNCLTALLAEEAQEAAERIDRTPEAYPLAGMPFVAKDLFDIAGRVTLAGSRINRRNPPAARNAALVARMKAAGAVLVGVSNMDEYAYGFITENAHYGATRNPHDPGRIAGGSSGGSAAAVAAGIVPVTLGSDTNGSIRVPAALCGIYGLKPTFGRLSRAGSFPFVASLDHVGPFAATIEDLALVYDLLQGPDASDPACTARPASPVSPALDEGLPPMRVGVLDGWFRQGASEAALTAVDRVAAAFANTARASLPGAGRARSAAFCMAGIEGGSLHAANLRRYADEFDPAVRDRLLAGVLLPAHMAMQVRRARQAFREEAAALFRDFDMLLAPVTPGVAPPIGVPTMVIDGVETPVRANLGLYAQPISFIGLPVIAVPVIGPGLPIGVQLIGPPWAEERLFRAASHLQRSGIVGANPVPAAARAEQTA